MPCPRLVHAAWSEAAVGQCCKSSSDAPTPRYWTGLVEVGTFTSNYVRDNSGQSLFWLLERQRLLILPFCVQKIHNLQLCSQYPLFGANIFSKCKQTTHHWFTSVINNFGMWNSGSLVLGDSQHLTFFSWQISQSYIKRFRASVLFQKQEVDNPELPSHLTPSGLLFILPCCECVIAAPRTVLRCLPQNLQTSTS